VKTLDLKEASKLLKMHPQTVRRMTLAGDLPGAKPGKAWVFIEEDLVSWLRSRYIQPRQVPEGEEVTQWHFSRGREVSSGGSDSPARTDAKYASLLGLRTGS